MTVAFVVVIFTLTYVSLTITNPEAACGIAWLYVPVILSFVVVEQVRRARC